MQNRSIRHLGELSRLFERGSLDDFHKYKMSMVQNSDNLFIYKRKYKDKLLAKYKE